MPKITIRIGKWLLITPRLTLSTPGLCKTSVSPATLSYHQDLLRIVSVFLSEKQDTGRGRLTRLDMQGRVARRAQVVGSKVSVTCETSFRFWLSSMRSVQSLALGFCHFGPFFEQSKWSYQRCFAPKWVPKNMLIYIIYLYLYLTNY